MRDYCVIAIYQERICSISAKEAEEHPRFASEFLPTTKVLCCFAVLLRIVQRFFYETFSFESIFSSWSDPSCPP